MEKILEIDSTGVSVITREKKFLCSEHEFFEEILSGQAISTGILPRNCIYYTKKDNGNIIYIIEYDQSIRKVNVLPKTSSNKSHIASLYVKLPVMLFFIKFKGDVFSGANLYSSYKKIQSLQDYLYIMPLPNIYSGGKICLGNGLSIKLKENNKNKKIASIIEHFWNSTFNDDLMEFNWPSAIKNIVLDIDNIQVNSVVKSMKSFQYLMRLSIASKEHLFHWKEDMLVKYKTVSDVLSVN
jgi:hypothetical protein